MGDGGLPFTISMQVQIILAAPAERLERHPSGSALQLQLQTGSGLFSPCAS
jgi:hypothetical protein